MYECLHKSKCQCAKVSACIRLYVFVCLLVWKPKCQNAWISKGLNPIMSKYLSAVEGWWYFWSYPQQSWSDNFNKNDTSDYIAKTCLAQKAKAIGMGTISRLQTLRMGRDLLPVWVPNTKWLRRMMRVTFLRPIALRCVYNSQTPTCSSHIFPLLWF